MITKASLRYIRISPRKFRLIIPLIKGKNAEEAVAILASIKKRASTYALELLKSALANAKRMQGVQVSDLYISKLIANGGPMLKRFRAASMGRASPILKRTSHVTVELDVAKSPQDDLSGAKAKAHAVPDKQGSKVSQARAEKTAAPSRRPKAEEAHTRKPKTAKKDD